MGVDIVDAIIFDLSRSFPTSGEIGELVETLGSPSALATSRNRGQPGAFWQFTFERWLRSDLQANIAAVYEAHEKLRPMQPRPGTPDGPI